MDTKRRSSPTGNNHGGNPDNSPLQDAGGQGYDNYVDYQDYSPANDQLYNNARAPGPGSGDGHSMGSRVSGNKQGNKANTKHQPAGGKSILLYDELQEDVWKTEKKKQQFPQVVKTPQSGHFIPLEQVCEPSSISLLLQHVVVH
jgi:hypothetical protein